MHKKTITASTEICTPKSVNRNIRTFSQLSSNSSNTKTYRPQGGKQNCSENSTTVKVETNNQSKAIQRIKQKAFGQGKPIVKQQKKQLAKEVEKGLVKSINQKSNKSLMTSRGNSGGSKQTAQNKNIGSYKQNIPNSNSSYKLSSLKQNIKYGVSDQNTKVRNNCNDFQSNSKNMFTNIQIANPPSKIVHSSPLNRKLKAYQPKIVLKNLSVSLFQIGEKLGEGQFSTTFKVVHMETGFLFCLKVFEKKKIREQNYQEQVVSEIKFRASVSHHCLQKLFAFFDDEIYIYFVEQFLDGFQWVSKQLFLKRKFSQKESGKIFRQLIEAVRYVHDNNYIHRDIRIQNLAKSLGVIKIVDFSWVTSLKYRKNRDTYCGIYKSAPPQLLQGLNYDYSTDIWSLGILLYEISTGQSPFPDNEVRSCQQVNFPIFLSNQLVDLIGKLIAGKNGRIGIQDIFEHEWIQRTEIDGFVSKQFWSFWVL